MTQVSVQLGGLVVQSAARALILYYLQMREIWRVGPRVHVLFAFQAKQELDVACFRLQVQVYAVRAFRHVFSFIQASDFLGTSAQHVAGCYACLKSLVLKSTMIFRLSWLTFVVSNRGSGTSSEYPLIRSRQLIAWKTGNSRVHSVTLMFID